MTSEILYTKSSNIIHESDEQKSIMRRGTKRGLDTARFNRCVSKVKSKSGKKLIHTRM
jgi:hypothetical protein